MSKVFLHKIQCFISSFLVAHARLALQMCLCLLFTKLYVNCCGGKFFYCHHFIMIHFSLISKLRCGVEWRTVFTALFFSSMHFSVSTKNPYTNKNSFIHATFHNVNHVQYMFHIQRFHCVCLFVYVSVCQ